MPQDKMPLDEITSQTTLAQMAQEYDVVNPIITSADMAQAWHQPESPEDDEEEMLTLSSVNDEVTKRSWKQSSMTRIIIVGGSLGLLAITLMGLLSIQMPKLGVTSVENVATTEKKETKLMFAEDGDYAAQSAYASQEAAFDDLDQPDVRKSNAASKQGSTQPKTPRPQATRPPSQPVRRVPAPPQSTVASRPVSRRSVAAPPKASVIPIPRTLAKRTTSPPATAPAPSQAPKAPIKAISPPAPLKPEIDPTEQWMIASGMGVISDTGAMPETAAARDEASPVTATPVVFNGYEESIYGVKIPIGSQMRGQLVSPIAFMEGMEGAQMVTIQLEPTEDLPAMQLLATYSPLGETQTKNAVVQLRASMFVVNGEQIPVHPDSILIGGKNGRGLIAKQQRSGGGFLSKAGRLLLGGGKEAFKELNQPKSQTTSQGTFGSFSSIENGDPNVLAAIGEGMFDQGADMVEESLPEQSLNGVWSMDAGESVELNFVQNVWL